MRDLILDQSEQITHSLEVNKSIQVEGRFDSIVLAGMGGSGHPGDLINALSLAQKPLYVHRNYDLPLDYLRNIGLTKPLVIVSSYSGNTEETLTAYMVAKENQLPVLASASGGRLQELAARNNDPFCLIDFPGLQPRHTLLAAFTGIYLALKNSGLARDIASELTAAAKDLTEQTASLETPAQELAQKIKDKIPVFISSESLGFAAKNFKIQTNENAKYPAFWNVFPELNHNELLGFSLLNQNGFTSSDNSAPFIAVFLQDAADHERNKIRLQVTKELYSSWGTDTYNFTAPGRNLLEKILLTVTFGLWTTFHLAQLNNVDPIPVAGVESFKKKLAALAGEIK